MSISPLERWNNFRETHSLPDAALVCGRLVVTPEENRDLTKALTGITSMPFPIVLLVPGASKDFSDGSKASNVDGHIRVFIPAGAADAEPADDE